MNKHWSETPTQSNQDADGHGQAQLHSAGARLTSLSNWADRTCAPITKRTGTTSGQLIVTGLCLLLLLTAIGNRLTADDGRDPVPEETVEYPVTEDARRAQKFASKVGATDKVKIVEQGYSKITDIGGDNLVTYGAVLENTDPKRVAHVAVGIQVRNAAGKSLIQDYAKQRIVRNIMPGERAGVVDCVYLSKPNVASVRIKVDKVAWAPVDPQHEYNAPLTASLRDVSVEKGQGHTMYWGKGGIRAIPADDSLLVRFDVRSEFDHVLGGVGAAVIFRNAKGAIIGGSDEIFSVYAEYPPGVSEHTMRVKYGPPPKVDTSRIEVYAYPTQLLGLRL